MSPKSDKNDIVNGQSGRPPGSDDVRHDNNNNNANNNKKNQPDSFESCSSPSRDSNRESISNGTRTPGRSRTNRDSTHESSSNPSRDPCPVTRTRGQPSTTVGGTSSGEPSGGPRSKRKRRVKKKLDEDEYVPLDSTRYADGAHASLYMSPPSSPPRNRTHDRTHQKKKGSRSRRTKPNKLNSLLSPLPDVRLHSVHHSVKYDRDQSRADKSSAGSNHTSIHKHHSVSHINPTSADRLDARMKNKRRGVGKSAISKSKSDLHTVSPTLPSQRAYSSHLPTRKEMFALLETIPEATRDWTKPTVNWTEKKSKFVPDPVPSRPVKPSMFINPFKFK